MDIVDLAVGDRVAVDLAGLYLAICGHCAQATLMVPDGICTRCRAPEASMLPDPLFDSGDAVRPGGDNVLPAE